MENSKIEVIDHKAIIKIELSGSFYKSVQNAMIHLSSYREPEELTALIEKLNTGVSAEDFDDWEASMETMLILCAEVEERAKEQKCTKEVDLPSEQVVEDTTVRDSSL
jgi:hypothetical protein